MRRFLTVGAGLVLTALLVVSCSDDEEAPPIVPTGVPPATVGTVSGIVYNSFGGTLNGATVAVGQANTSSNEQGYFLLPDVDTGDVVVAISADNHASTYRAVTVLSGQTTHLERVALVVAETEIIDASTGGQVQTNDGDGSVAFSAGSFVTAGGAAYTGDVEVVVSAAVPDDPNFIEGFSGDFEGRREDGSTVPFESYGYMGVNLFTSGGLDRGQPIALGDGEEAELRLNIGEGFRQSAPDTIPMWHFDENEGVWIEEGFAYRAGNEYVTSVSHFTIWNWDLPLEDICSITGIVVNGEGTPVENARVISKGETVTYMDEAYTNAAGQFNVRAVRLSTASVWAIKGSYASEQTTVGVGTVCPVVLENALALLEPAFAIALSWGQEPRDLDSHLFIPMDWEISRIQGDSYDYYHIAYYNEGELGEDPFTILDTDDTTSFGPEIISGFSFHPGTYEYWVHLYSGESSLSGSPAIVNLEVAGQVRSYDASTASGTETDYWHVFDFSTGGVGGVNIVDVNRFEDPSSSEGRWANWHNGEDTVYPDTDPNARLSLEK